jgi:glycosyltransferase involved in cell wall biosynthesis
MKDNALVQQLKHMGHDAVMLPMYLPHILDEEPADEDQPIFFGGINAYLQLKYSFFRHVPKWLDKVLDSRPLLGKVAKAQKGNMTAGREISEMALSTFQGEKGPLAKEFRHLVQWAVERENPDAIYLSTAMQVGLAPAIKQRRDIPVFCSLQGEDTFLESLIEPYKTQIWELMREASVAVEKYISPSKAFADCMAKPLRLNKDRIAIIPNGINLDGYEPRTSPPDRPAIGYLARMSNLKGLDILVDAFIHLHQLGNLPIDTELRIAGTTLPDDQSYIDEQIRKLDEAGLQGRYTFRQNITRDEKIEHLRNLTVLSVPTRYGEAFGLYAAEAMAAGIPVVQPDHGAFPEIMAATGGGAIFFPNTPEALADALLPWINDPAKAHATGKKAHAAVKEHYSIQRHAEQMLQCLPVHA